jgi:ribosomal-protein-alanine N-acetyltransferase
MLETTRLLIRKFTFDDLDELIELRSDPEVNKYLGGTRLQNAESITKRMQFYIDCYEKYGFGAGAMIWKPTGEMCGWSGLQPLEETGEIEVGYGMAQKFWGKGIGYECATAWLKFGFETANLKRIVAVASPKNTGSWRIMEKCGMCYEKTEQHYGETCVLYAIERDEFLKHQI